MPLTHMTARPRRPYATPSKAPFTTYAISALDDTPRSTRRTRSQTAILDGNAPSRPDYHTAAHSGFAASAASAPPPLRTSPPPRSPWGPRPLQVVLPGLALRRPCIRRTRSQTVILDGNAPSRPDYRTAAHSGFAASAASAPPPLRTSLPPRSAHLGSTTSTGRLASTSSTPTPLDLQSDPPPPTAPLHPTAPDFDVQAAAAHFSNTLLNYSNSDLEQAQHEYCLSATTSQLPPDQMVLLPALDDLLSMTPFASMYPSWPDRGSCMHATPMPPVTSVLCAPSKCLNASTGGLVWNPARNGGGAAA